MEGHLAPVSRKEGLVSSPTEAQSPGQEPEARTRGPQQDMERQLYFYLGELLGQTDQDLMRSNCQAGGPGPQRDNAGRGAGPRSFCPLPL